MVRKLSAVVEAGDLELRSFEVWIWWSFLFGEGDEARYGAGDGAGDGEGDG